MINIYRQLRRRIQNLPLDIESIRRLRNYNKIQFEQLNISAETLDIRCNRAKHYLQQMDNLFNANNIERKDALKTIDLALDIAYKHSVKQQDWAMKFLSTKSENYLDIWPEGHLMVKMADKQDSHWYKTYIQREKDQNTASISDLLGIETSSAVLEPIATPTISQQEELPFELQKAKLFHSFLKRAGSDITSYKIQSFVVEYPMTPLGLPIHVSRRRNLRLKKINQIKTYVRELIPMREQDFRALLQFVHNKTLGLNPRYFSEKSPIKERTIRRRYDSYLKRQFFISEDGTYHSRYS